jgi:hypothetical protein
MNWEGEKEGEGFEHWGLRDDLGQMQQLGVLPSLREPNG